MPVCELLNDGTMRKTDVSRRVETVPLLTEKPRFPGIKIWYGEKEQAPSGEQLIHVAEGLGQTGQMLQHKVHCHNIHFTPMIADQTVWIPIDSEI